MTYGTRDDGTGYIELNAEENKAFQRGVGIFRRTADAKGVATICLKLTRPKRKRDRFPEAMGYQRS